MHLHDTRDAIYLLGVEAADSAISTPQLKALLPRHEAALCFLASLEGRLLRALHIEPQHSFVVNDNLWRGLIDSVVKVEWGPIGARKDAIFRLVALLDLIEQCKLW